MTEKQESLLKGLELRIKQLMFLCESLEEDKVRLKQELEKKNEEVKILSSNLSDIQLKYANLKIVKSFASENNGDVDKAKAKISKLVQDVDKCISMLKG